MTRETLIIPPNGQPRIVCQNFPECMCGEDCIDRSDARMVRLLLRLFITGTIAIGAGLLFVGLR